MDKFSLGIALSITAFYLIFIYEAFLVLTLAFSIDFLTGFFVLLPYILLTLGLGQFVYSSWSYAINCK